MHKELSFTRQSPRATTQETAVLTWQAALFIPVDVASLALFRVAFGLIMVWEVWRYFANDWIRRYYIAPEFFFSYPGFGWVQPWPGMGMYIHFWVMGLLALCVAVGYRYRLSATLLFLAFTYVFLLDQTRYLNHFYLLSLISFALLVVPAHRALSVDVRSGHTTHTDDTPAWSLWLLRFLVGIPYLYGGIAKLNPDWLQGEPMRMWLANRTDFPLIGPFFTEEWLIYSFTYGGLLLDLLVVPLLLWKPTRIWAFLAAVTFHLLNAKLFQIGIFPWFMIAATTLFFNPAWPRLNGALWPRLAPHKRRRSKDAHASLSEITPRSQRWIAAALALFVAVQILLPFRHLLYPGDVNWTEEGHRYAWHMKLRQKNGTITFYVHHPATNQTWQVDPDEYLTTRQTRKMATRPSMILEFAHFLAADFARAGYANVEVRADSVAALNGRPYQRLIDPEVDLAAQTPSILPLSWIVPLTTPLH